MMPTHFSEASIGSLIAMGETITKLDISEHEGNRRFIAGYANVAGIRDKQGDIVTREALVGAWNKFKKNPEYAFCSILHSNIPAAKVVFEPVKDSKGRVHQSGVNETGLYIVAQVRDDVTISEDVWRKIEMGEYRGFSIGGRNLNPQPKECEDGVCTSKITDFELYEVAIVDRPANQVSLFNVLKRDDLASLAELTNKIRNSTLTEGVVKISKKPCPDGGHYHVVINAKGELYNEMSKIFSKEDMVIIEDERAGEEYVNLFNLALLRPYMGLTEEELNGGFNSPPLSDEPKKEGETPLNKEEDVIEDTIEESQDDSETSETPEVEKEDEEEAIAPLTLEVLAAALERINQRLDDFEKKLEPEAVEKVEETPELPEEVAEVMKSTEEEIEKPVEEPVEVPEVQEEVPVIVAQSAPPQEIPIVPEPTAAEVVPQEVAPVVAPVVTPEPEPVVESRGVNLQTVDSGGLDLGGLHTNVSWKDIQNLRDIRI